jgi:hypothetical protein
MMRSPLVAAIAIVLLSGTSARLYAQQPSADAGHAEHQTSPAPAHDHDQPPAAKPDIDALILNMQSATGAARTDAMAEVLTALVQQHKDCEAKMAGMKPGMGSHPKASASPSPAP